MTDFATKFHCNSPFSNRLNDLIQAAQKSCYPRNDRFINVGDKYSTQIDTVSSNQNPINKASCLRAYDIDLSPPAYVNDQLIVMNVGDNRGSSDERSDTNDTRLKGFTNDVNVTNHPALVTPPSIFGSLPRELPLIVKPLRQSQVAELKALKKSGINAAHCKTSFGCRNGASSAERGSLGLPNGEISTTVPSWRAPVDCEYSAGVSMAKYNSEKLDNANAEGLTNDPLAIIDEGISQNYLLRGANKCLGDRSFESQTVSTSEQPHDAFRCHEMNSFDYATPIIGWKSPNEGLRHSSPSQQDKIKADTTRSISSTSYERATRRLTVGGDSPLQMPQWKSTSVKDYSRNSFTASIPPIPPTSSPPLLQQSSSQPSRIPFLKNACEPTTRKAWFSSSVDGPVEKKCSSTLPRSYPKKPRNIKKNASANCHSFLSGAERSPMCCAVQRSHSFGHRATLPYIDDDENLDPNALRSCRSSEEPQGNFCAPPKPARSYTEFIGQNQNTSSAMPSSKHSVFRTTHFFRDITRAKNVEDFLSNTPRKCRIFRRKSASASSKPSSPPPYEHLVENIQKSTNHADNDLSTESITIYKNPHATTVTTNDSPTENLEFKRPHDNIKTIASHAIMTSLNAEHYRNQSTHSVDSGCFVTNSRKNSMDYSEPFRTADPHQRSSTNKDEKWLSNLLHPFDNDDSSEYDYENGRTSLRFLCLHSYFITYEKNSAQMNY